VENPFTRSNATIALPLPTCLRKHSWRVWAHVLLALASGFSVLIGIWFVGVRPILHQQAVMQLDTAWSGAESQASMYLVNLPDGQQNLLFSERLLSDALNASDAHSVQHWQVTVTPAHIRLSFTTCDQSCLVTVLLSVSQNNEIQVTQVQVQGMFALIMSNDEFMENLRRFLPVFKPFLSDRVTKITLLEHAISIQLS
jgi:hypothetical protein